MVPQTKLAAVLTWKGVRLVPDRLAGMSGKAAAACVTLTFGVLVDRVDETAVAVAVPVLLKLTLS